MKNVAIILSGCGVYDGSEIHETVLTQLALARHNAEVTCAAPNIEQAHVFDHLVGHVADRESRNVLTEAARLARGEIGTEFYVAMLICETGYNGFFNISTILLRRLLLLLW